MKLKTLRSGATDTYIQRDRNSVRRRCVVLYLDTMCDEDKKIKESEKRFAVRVYYMSQKLPVCVP